jgi:hypothetical protein
MNKVVNFTFDSMQHEIMYVGSQVRTTSWQTFVLISMQIYFNVIIQPTSLGAGHRGRAVWGVGLGRLVAGNVGSNPA